MSKSSLKSNILINRADNSKAIFQATKKLNEMVYTGFEKKEDKVKKHPSKVK